MATHFGNFSVKKTVPHRVKEILTYLSRQNGWFVPVSQLLDYLIETKGHSQIMAADRMALERRWLWQSLKQRISA